MVANSEHSATNEKRSTRKTNSLTPEQSLEILQQAIINCQQSGIEVELVTADEDNATILIMRQMAIVDGNLRMVAK